MLGRIFLALPSYIRWSEIACIDGWCNSKKYPEDMTIPNCIQDMSETSNFQSNSKSGEE